MPVARRQGARHPLITSFPVPGTAAWLSFPCVRSRRTRAACTASRRDIHWHARANVSARAFSHRPAAAAAGHPCCLGARGMWTGLLSPASPYRRRSPRRSRVHGGAAPLVLLDLLRAAHEAAVPVALRVCTGTAMLRAATRALRLCRRRVPGLPGTPCHAGSGEESKLAEEILGVHELCVVKGPCRWSAHTACGDVGAVRWARGEARTPGGVSLWGDAQGAEDGGSGGKDQRCARRAAGARRRPR